MHSKTCQGTKAMNKLAIIGYGKMGKSVEKLANSYGFEICSIIDPTLNNKITRQSLNSADVAVEFTTPDTAVNNIISLIDAGTNVVSGSTGWDKHLQQAINYCNEKKAGFFYSSNFSIGMNIMFHLNRQFVAMLNKTDKYRLSITETHHAQKKDKPSGTAITLANGIIHNHSAFTKWELAPSQIKDTLPIYSKREGDIIGQHAVIAESEDDIITLQHEALSRNAFTTGALMACKFILNKTGYYTMNDLIFQN